MGNLYIYEWETGPSLRINLYLYGITSHFQDRLGDNSSIWCSICTCVTHRLHSLRNMQRMWCPDSCRSLTANHSTHDPLLWRVHVTESPYSTSAWSAECPSRCHHHQNCLQASPVHIKTRPRLYYYASPIYNNCMTAAPTYWVIRHGIEVFRTDVTRKHQKTGTNTSYEDRRLQRCSTTIHEDGSWRRSVVLVWLFVIIVAVQD